LKGSKKAIAFNLKFADKVEMIYNLARQKKGVKEKWKKNGGTRGRCRELSTPTPPLFGGKTHPLNAKTGKT